MEKTCKDCGAAKSAAEFYAAATMRDGLSNSCKVCTKARVNAHRAANLERARAADRARSLRPDRRDYQKRKYAELREEYLLWHSRANRGYRLRHPARYKARTAVSNALRDGLLVKAAHCQYPGCECPAVQAHHDDYDKPLEVRWLCQPHHAAADRERRANEREQAR